MRRLALILVLLALPASAAEFRALVGHGGPVMDAAISSDGSKVLTASFDNSVGLWTLGSDDVVWLEGHEAAVKSVLFLSDGRAASGGDDFAVEIWELTSGKRIHRLEGHKGQVNGLALSPDGRVLASAGWDGSIWLWDVESGAAIAEMTGHESSVSDVAFSRGGETLYSA
ncbi:MAG: cytochrome C, partial [Silicimonas sp.]|nr:cytochrome C [Silicimonas sp.]